MKYYLNWNYRDWVFETEQMANDFIAFWKFPLIQYMLEEKLYYKGYWISRAPAYTRCKFQFVSENYDGPGDNRLGFTYSIEECKEQIDEQLLQEA